MQLENIENVDWTIYAKDFLNLYRERPIFNNDGGMMSPHMFASYCLLQFLTPSTIIESGVYKGQGIWLFEKTLPDATLYSIDLDLWQRQYISPNVVYLDSDFNTYDWWGLPKHDTLVFFDDHTNAPERISELQRWGFKFAIFEDNYPLGQGDCLSLKKIKDSGGDLVGVKKYYEFPPVYKTLQTRWNTLWSQYPTSKPIYNDDCPAIFKDEAMAYTWMCVVELE